MLYEEAAEILKKGRKLIFVHGNADLDAVGSAYVLSRCFGNCDIFAPCGIERVAKMVIDKMGIPIIEEADLSDYDQIVAVDTSSPEQLAPAEIPLVPETFVIDHHSPTGKWEGVTLLCDDTMVACAEIVLQIVRAAGFKLDRECGLALLGAMLTDGGHFQFATPRLFRDFADVMDEAGVYIDEALELVKAPMIMSERVASMKCVGRSKFDRVGDMIVATAISGSFEASGCRALLASGADVVFVASQREDTFRISARTTQEMIRRGIHLGDTLKTLGVETGTDGGGHAGASGISGVGDAEAMLHLCMQKTMDDFRRIKKNMLAASEGSNKDSE